MNKLCKRDIIGLLAKREQIAEYEAERIVGIFFDEMSKALANGDRVEIRGLFSFFVKEHGGYVGRNPKTGRKVKVKSKKLPFFKCGDELKRRVDAGWDGQSKMF